LESITTEITELQGRDGATPKFSGCLQD